MCERLSSSLSLGVGQVRKEFVSDLPEEYKLILFYKTKRFYF